MSDSDDENYVTYGSALEPLDEENLPRKKPMTIEDQYAYDAQGRRRFHGAFTGGFSAGYFNTVGTRDGWRPQQFKSSRSSKAGGITQRPEDFMDEEDTSEFGIAPKGIRATSDYADHGQRGTKRERVTRDNEGPIPGCPVLKELLKPVRDTVGITLLKQMGWRPGQGVGSRLTKKEKAKIKLRNQRIRMSHEDSGKAVESNSEESDDDHADITFAPDDYEPFRCNPKDNYFGIGYSGLERRNILSSHVNLFDAPVFSIQDKNKKLSIQGQAFGVGAFEADDEDIYAKEDMSRYDFSLGPERKAKSRWSQDAPNNSGIECLEGFVKAKDRWKCKKTFAPPELPKDFVPVHAVRKSRFHPPIEVPHRSTLENGKRRDLNALDRAKILEDKTESNKITATSSVASNIVSRTLNLHGRQQTEERQRLENQQAKATTSWMDKLNATNFVKGGVMGPEQKDGSLKTLEDFKDSSLTVEPSEKTEEKEDSVSKPESAKPFLSDPDKQRRFEQYLELLKTGEKHKLESIQPLSMTEWDRDHERIEFEQAAKLFQQTGASIADKFVRENDSAIVDRESVISNAEKDMKEAAKMKLFGKLTRERVDWKPTSIVCKRFNVPEPKVGCAEPGIEKKSTRFSVFDSLNWCNSAKFSKATDTAPKEAEIEYKPSKKLPDASNDSVSNLKEHNEPQSNHAASKETSEPVSEKMKNFSAVYEKVFGKEVQDISAVKSKESKQTDLHTAVDKDTNVQPPDSSSNETSQEAVDVSKNATEKKKDLFKAIFLSSSEDSDSDSDENVDSEAVKSVLIGKVPTEVNTQRNTSPPRGIFAKVDLDNLITPPKSNNEVNETETSKRKTEDSPADSQTTEKDNKKADEVPEVEMLPDMYGPALPAKLLKNENTAAEASSSQIPKPVFRSVVVPKVNVDSKYEGKWVEREKLKKSKKEKKKHKHKEHKSSKHKKKSKKDKR